MPEPADYADAIKKLQKYLKQQPDGTFTIIGAEAAGIDPIIFADLQRSLEITNDNVLAGHYRVGDTWTWSIP